MQVRDLTSWSSSLRTSISRAVRVRDAAMAQLARADHEAARADIEARDDSFRLALEAGQRLVAAGHPGSAEVEDKCEALLEERQRLLGAWAARQVALDQLIDLHCFLRDAKQLHDLCSAQEAALSESPSLTQYHLLRLGLAWRKSSLRNARIGKYSIFIE